MNIDTIVERIVYEVSYIVEDIVKPLQLIYFAVDGVAPRAKLNQQRARRFKSAKEQMKELEHSKQPSSSVFDSNCITPGTEFMAKVSQGLQKFIENKLKTHDLWRNLKVIFSGSEVPGEGEHKLISYLRELREKSLLKPNTKICIYGADADMIMLALATHEPFTIILREAVEIYKGPKHERHDSNNWEKPPETPHTPAVHKKKRKMQYIRINLLREYLFNEFAADAEHHRAMEGEEDELDWGDGNVSDGSNNGRRHQKKGHNKKHGDQNKVEHLDMERLMDDFVFMTFFIGNDFLPHLPGLDIGDNAFDIIFDAYKTVYSSDPGYLLEEGKFDYHRLELLFTLIGNSENVLFEEKNIQTEVQEHRHQLKQARAGASSPSTNYEAATPRPYYHETGYEVNESTKSSYGGTSSFGQSENVSTKSDYSVPQFSAPPFIHHHDGEYFRRLYYQTKFGIPVEGDLLSNELMRTIVKEYLAGLEWCQAYYSRGCVSWNWFYPYHYGPFLSEMKNLAALGSEIVFQLSKPLQPFQQLLACLPPYSGTLLPTPYRNLMTSPDSRLRDFYPDDFELDMNGKKREYEAVVLLPFIDIHLLLEETRDLPSRLNPEEQKRNTFGEILFYSLGDQSTVNKQNFAPNFSPNKCFEAKLLPGTADEILPDYPNLYHFGRQDKHVQGKTMYFSYGKHNSDGEGYSHRGRGGGRGRGRGGGGGSIKAEHHRHNSEDGLPPLRNPGPSAADILSEENEDDLLGEGIVDSGKYNNGGGYSNGPRREWRGGRGRGNTPSSAGGKYYSHKKNYNKNEQGFFPMPGNVNVPVLSQVETVPIPAASSHSFPHGFAPPSHESTPSHPPLPPRSHPGTPHLTKELLLASQQEAASKFDLRLLLDTNSDAFLQALAYQIRQQAPYFTPFPEYASLNNNGNTDGPSTIFSVTLSLSEYFLARQRADGGAFDATAAVNELKTFVSTELKGPILEFRGKFIPKIRVLHQNEVAVVFEDFGQLQAVEMTLFEQFIVKTVPTTAQPPAFTRRIILGRVEDMTQLTTFNRWLEEEIGKYAEMFPIFSSSLVELSGRDEFSVNMRVKLKEFSER
jgi:hypothetical protein